MKPWNRLMGSNEKIVFITADLGFKLFDRIAARYPDRVINVGIREATMIGIAAGLSKEGFLPFVYSLVPFVTLRCVEQIRVDLCYNDLPAVLVGVGSGLAYGPNGPTHMGIEDVGVMSALPNLTILSPCDAVEVRMLLPQAVRLKTPVYVRLGRSGEPLCHRRACPQTQNRPPVRAERGHGCHRHHLRSMTHEVLTAVDELEKEKGLFDQGRQLAYLEAPEGKSDSPVGPGRHPGHGDRGTDVRRESGEPVGPILQGACDS